MNNEQPIINVAAAAIKRPCENGIVAEAIRRKEVSND